MWDRKCCVRARERVVCGNAVCERVARVNVVCEEGKEEEEEKRPGTERKNKMWGTTRFHYASGASTAAATAKNLAPPLRVSLIFLQIFPEITTRPRVVSASTCKGFTQIGVARQQSLANSQTATAPQPARSDSEGPLRGYAPT